jgi:hypothetical protein
VKTLVGGGVAARVKVKVTEAEGTEGENGAVSLVIYSQCSIGFFPLLLECDVISNLHYFLHPAGANRRTW